MSAMVAIAPRDTSQSSWLTAVPTAVSGRNGATGKNVSGAVAPRNIMRAQRDQRGTNCPDGNRRKTSKSNAVASKFRHWFGTTHGEGPGDTLLVWMIGPKG